MKEDEPGTKEQLINELNELRQKIAELKQAEAALILGKTEWQKTFDSLNDAITVHDSEFTILLANKAAEKIVGLPAEELSGKKCYQLFHGSGSPLPDCPCFQLYKTGKTATLEKFEPRLNKFIEIKALPFFDQDSEITKVVHVVRDITDQRRMEENLKVSEEKYRSLVETTDDSIYIVDRDCRYLFINKKHLARLGLSDDELYIGRQYAEYHTPEETEWFHEKIRKVFETGAAYQYEHMSKRDNNHFLLTLSPINSGDGRISSVSIISKNITEFKRMQEKLRMLSITDDLTGFYNRRGFFSFAEHHLKIADRMRRGLFLLYADIDNLKQVNDRFGHNEGDRLIIRTAELLKETFRNSDIIARVGGDEFVIFPLEAEEGALDQIFDRLQNKITIMNSDTAPKYPISLSIGSAYYDPSKPCSIAELLNRADISMYEGKINKNKQK